MDFGFSEKEEAFREEIRDFLKRADLPPEGLPADEAANSAEQWARFTNFVRSVATKGWLTMAWSKEYGGLAASPTEQLVFTEEMAYHIAPAMTVGATWVGPAIMIFGTPEQKRRFLPQIAAGEIMISLGYSEPNAGSDLASLQTTAIEQSDCYVVNGQKIWTSQSHRTDYIWLAARSDLNVPKHKGISVFLVDTKTPGITFRPFEDMRNVVSFNEVYFDNVKIPKDCLIGEKNRGWEIILTALTMERTTYGGGANVTAVCRRTLDKLIKYVKEAELNGKPLAQNTIVRQQLAQMATDIEVSKLLAYRLSHMQKKGIVPHYEASISKVFGSEMEIRLANAAMDILGLCSQVEKGSKLAPVEGEIESLYLWSVAEAIGAGTNEIQRNVIAKRGLGLPG